MTSALSHTIHLALTPWDLTDDYNRHAGVTLLSFLDHCGTDTHVVAHLLYDSRISIGKEQETEYNKSCYQKIAEMYNCTVIFHHVELPEWIDAVPAIKKWTPGSLLRLCLPRILPDVDKVIYLDCDMVVATDMETLWNVPLGENYLAAVPDSSWTNIPRKTRDYCNRKNIPIEGYFCSGILVFNLKKLRACNPSFEEVIFDYLYKNNDLHYPDQDMLNWFCQGQYLPLEGKYNIYSGRLDALQFIDDGILHYASKGKPWKRYAGVIDDPYWKYLVQTPWAENSKQLLGYVRAAPSIVECFSVLPEYYAYQEGATRLEITAKVLTLSFRLPFALLKGLFSIIMASFKKLRIYKI